jgi:hypothetical protein
MYPQVDTSGTGYQPPDERTLNVVRSLLSAGVANALERTADNLILVAHSLFGSGRGSEDHPSQPAPILQVSEAIRAMEGASIIGRALQRGVKETLNFFPSLGLHDHRDE